MGVISGILAVLKALPILDQWFRGLVAAYAQWKIAAHDKAFTDGMRDLIANGDQRKLEEAAGMNPGPNPDQSDIITRPRSPK